MFFETKEFLIAIILFLCSIQDLKKKSLSLCNLLCFSFFALFLGLFFHDISTANRLFGLLLGLLVVLISFLTHGQIGNGDGFLLCITGYLLGFQNNLLLLCYALFLSAVTAIILLSFRWTSKKYRLPFIPFIFLSYLCIYFVQLSYI